MTEKLKNSSAKQFVEELPLVSIPAHIMERTQTLAQLKSAYQNSFLSSDEKNKWFEAHEASRTVLEELETAFNEIGILTAYLHFTERSRVEIEREHLENSGQRNVLTERLHSLDERENEPFLAWALHCVQDLEVKKVENFQERTQQAENLKQRVVCDPNTRHITVYSKSNKKRNSKTFDHMNYAHPFLFDAFLLFLSEQQKTVDSETMKQMYATAAHANPTITLETSNWSTRELPILAQYEGRYYNLFNKVKSGIHIIEALAQSWPNDLNHILKTEVIKVQYETQENAIKTTYSLNVNAEVLPTRKKAR